MQSFFIGIGAIVASALPWMMTNWFEVSNTAAAGVVPAPVPTMVSKAVSGKRSGKSARMPDNVRKHGGFVGHNVRHLSRTSCQTRRAILILKAAQ